MLLDWPSERYALLKEKLLACEDCECTGTDEYVIDFFETDVPVSMEISLSGGKVQVLAAERLTYDEGMDGWYLSAPIADGALLWRTLESLL